MIGIVSRDAVFRIEVLIVTGCVFLVTFSHFNFPVCYIYIWFDIIKPCAAVALWWWMYYFFFAIQMNKHPRAFVAHARYDVQTYFAIKCFCVMVLAVGQIVWGCEPDGWKNSFVLLSAHADCIYIMVFIPLSNNIQTTISLVVLNKSCSFIFPYFHFPWMQNICFWSWC